MLFEKEKKEEKGESDGERETKSEKEEPRLITTLSEADIERPPVDTSRLIMKKHESNGKCELDNIKGESYFVDQSGKGRFIVKRFIRDFVWKKYIN
jgi:hypothetical protein